MSKYKPRIFLCGGAGYIGTVLLEKLLKKSYRVILCDLLYFGLGPIENLLEYPNLTVIQKNINDINHHDLKDIDIVINLAAISNDPSCDLDPNETTTTNYIGNSHLAQLSKQLDIKKYLFMSSCSVYGDNDTDDCKETTETKPLTIYAKSKVLSEERLLSLNSPDFNVVIFRSGTAFGASKRMRFDLVLNKMTLDAYKTGALMVNGDGNQMRPFTHIEDISNAIIGAIELKKIYHDYPIYNLASTNTTIKTLAETVSDLMNAKIVYLPGNKDNRSYRVNTEKIETILKFKPTVTIKDGINDIKQWIEKSSEDLYSNKYYTINYYKDLFHKK